MRSFERHNALPRIASSVGKSLLLLAVFCVLAVGVRAQQEEQTGVDQGNYNVKQSIEFGGRFVDVSGETGVYDTFVNLQQGPRLLGFSVEMNSLNHHGTLFDRFYFSNFRSEEHTSELQSRRDLVCRLLLEKKNKILIDL